MTDRKNTPAGKPAARRKVGIIGFGDREQEQLEIIKQRLGKIREWRGPCEPERMQTEPKQSVIDEESLSDARATEGKKLANIVTASVVAGIRARGPNRPSRASAIPTLKEFREQWQLLSPEQAADFLRCGPRTIRNYLKNKTLTKVGRGKVACDDKWARILRKSRPDCRVM